MTVRQHSLSRNPEVPQQLTAAISICYSSPCKRTRSCSCAAVVLAPALTSAQKHVLYRLLTCVSACRQDR